MTRLTPLTDTDADEMINAVRVAPLLAGDQGMPPLDTAGLANALLRVSRLADDLPEVSELDLNPVVVRPDGVYCVDVRVRISPAEPRDPSCAGCCEPGQVTVAIQCGRMVPSRRYRTCHDNASSSKWGVCLPGPVAVARSR